jgi:GcrA cell cycle regulator
MLEKWTEGRVAAVERLWRDGKSASEIANEIGGTTRNAVIGKLHRLGLSAKTQAQVRTKPKPVKTVKPKKDDRKAVTGVSLHGREIVHVAPPVALPPLPGDVYGAVAAINSMPRFGRCRFPFGDPVKEDFRFCLEPTGGTATYCPSCAKLTYDRPARAA